MSRSRPCDPDSGRPLWLGQLASGWSVITRNENVNVNRRGAVKKGSKLNCINIFRISVRYLLRVLFACEPKFSFPKCLASGPKKKRCFKNFRSDENISIWYTPFRQAIYWEELLSAVMIMLLQPLKIEKKTFAYKAGTSPNQTQVFSIRVTSN